MYIAIEGPKGCGKSTLIERLQQQLSKYCVEVFMLCPTRPIPIAHPLEQLAANSTDDTLCERLYAARSNYHAAQVPPNAQLVLGDRSILTSYATRWDRFSATQRHLCIDRVDSMENLICRPNHVIFLNVPVAQLLARLKARLERRYGKHDETPERLIGALAAYREMRECRTALGLDSIVWHDIDATAEPDVVLTHVVTLILKIIDLHSVCTDM